jgi:hypothetical protein
MRFHKRRKTMKKFIIAGALLFSATPSFAQNVGDVTVTNATSGSNAAVFFVQLTTPDGKTPFANSTPCLTSGQSAGVYPPNYGPFIVYTGACTHTGETWSPSNSPLTQASPSNPPAGNYDPIPVLPTMYPQYYYNINCSDSTTCGISSVTVSGPSLDAKKMKARAK